MCRVLSAWPFARAWFRLTTEIFFDLFVFFKLLIIKPFQGVLGESLK